MVIRCSSVSTLTRIDWLAILDSWTSPSVAAAFLEGFASFARGSLAASAFGAGAAGASSATGAAAGPRLRSRSRGRRRSRSSSDSPGRNGRSSTWSTSMPAVARAGLADFDNRRGELQPPLRLRHDCRPLPSHAICRDQVFVGAFGLGFGRFQPGQNFLDADGSRTRIASPLAPSPACRRGICPSGSRRHAPALPAAAAPGSRTCP